MQSASIAQRAGAIGAAAPLGGLRSVTAMATTRRRRATPAGFLRVGAEAAGVVAVVVVPVMVRRGLAGREAMLLGQAGRGVVMLLLQVVIGGGLLLSGDEFADAEELIELDLGLGCHLVEIGDVGQVLWRGARPLLGGVELLAELVREVEEDVTVLRDLNGNINQRRGHGEPG